jgi:hypothetical protein
MKKLFSAFLLLTSLLSFAEVKIDSVNSQQVGDSVYIEMYVDFDTLDVQSLSVDLSLFDSDSLLKVHREISLSRLIQNNYTWPFYSYSENLSHKFVVKMRFANPGLDYFSFNVSMYWFNGNYRNKITSQLKNLNI